MSVILLQQPDPISFSRNPIVYQLQSNNFIVSGGVKAVTRLLAADLWQDMVIPINWNGRSLSFTIRNDYQEGGSGTELPAGQNSFEYISLLRDCFLRVFLIQEDFDILINKTSDNFWYLDFVAKKPGQQYNIEISFITPFNKLQTVVTGVVEQRRSNFCNYVELWVQNGDHTGYERVYEASLPIDATGTSTVDFSEALHSLLTSDLPNLAIPVNHKCTRSIRKFYIRYAEAYGAGMAIQQLRKSEERTVTLGGLDYRAYTQTNFTSLLLDPSGDRSKDRFLVQGENFKVIRTDQVEYLSFINLRNVNTDAGLNVTVYFDNNTSVHFIAGDRLFLAQYEKAQFATGYTDLNLNSKVPVGRYVTHYTVQLTVGEDYKISELRTYYLDYTPREWVRYFFYLSSWGAFDTLITYGKGSKEYELTRETAEKVLITDYKLSDGQFVEFDISRQEKFTVATGFLSRRAMLQLADFYLSRHKYRVSKANAYPVGITSKTIKEGKDGDSLYSQSFEYSYLFKDDCFTENQEEFNGVTFDGFFFEGPVTLPGEESTETDPTVPNHVKAITAAQISNWIQAFGWGNHATQGYLKAADLPTIPAHVYNITVQEKQSWNEAASWGDHRLEGYLKGIPLEEIEVPKDTPVPFTIDWTEERLAVFGNRPSIEAWQEVAPKEYSFEKVPVKMLMNDDESAPVEFKLNLSGIKSKIIITHGKLQS